MRRANQNTAVITEGGNALLSFGYDFCSEHEWGTDRLKRELGVSNDKNDLTVGRYAVTGANESNTILIEANAVVEDYSGRRTRKVRHKRLYLLAGNERPWRDQTLEHFVTGYRESFPKADKPEAHWDEGSCLFSVPTGGEDEATVRAVHAAMLAGDALLYQAGSGNPFGGSGLVIVRRSTIAPHHIADMEAGFRDQKALADAAEATGIRKRVEAWGRSKGSFGGAFFALSPKWMFEDRKRTSAHPVIFWLNPYDQQNNNFGWFTVEQLEQWMEGKGPIPKRKAA